ncbi:MAG: hypothetical protein ACYTDY_09350 [Planctomycetota bacterium]
MKTRVTLIVLVLLFAAAPADAKGEKKKLDPIDFNAYAKLLPKMKEINVKSRTFIYTLNKLVKALEQTLDDDKAAGLRAEIRKLLVDHRETKLQMIEYVDRALMKGEPERSDLDALRALRSTELKRVGWKNQFLKYVARDISQAIGVPIRLNAKVQELNQIEIFFPEITAEGVMQIICENFDLKYIVFEGEFLVLKKIGPNEGRFREWEKKHGKVDWIGEDEARTYEDLPVAKAKRKLKKLEDMDLPLLRQNMTKIYILEGQNRIHEARLEELKAVAKMLEAVNDPKFEEEKHKRHKHTLHYLYMERENSIEIWHVINLVLGDVLELNDPDEEFRKILQLNVKKIEWVGKDLEEALYELGRMVGIPVEADLPPYMDITVSLSVENVTVETVIKLICNIHPLDYKYINGKLFFAHMGGSDD